MFRERFIHFLLALFLLTITTKNRPIGFTQVQKITTWWPESSIAKSIGVPGYANTEYNYFSFGTWSCTNGLGSMSTVFARPLETFGSNFLGKTDAAIRAELKNKYQGAGAKVFLSAFADTDHPVRFGKSPTDCATKLANDVKSFDFDGVQIVFQDDYSISQGKAEQWLIDFTKKLRQLLPTQKIVHTVTAKYFQPAVSPNGGYIKINKQVGSIIDFYNIKYYASVQNAYDTYNELFIKSSSPNTGTSVKEISAAGVPMEKIVIGKSAKSGVNGYVDPAMLGNWAVSAKNQVGWKTGFWLGSFQDDQEGTGIKNALKLLEFSDDDDIQPTPAPTPTPTPQPQPTPTPTPTPQPDNKNDSVVPTTGYKLPYPIYVAYVNGVTTWYGDEFLAGMGVPGYAKENPYNYFVLAFWLTSGPVDMAIVWAQASKYFSWLGTDTNSIQIQLKKAYNDAGKKILVSAFGATQFPTTQGKEAIKTANDLADFVLANNLDGVDIDWQDNGAMEAGTGQEWLIKFQTTLRARLPNHIIIHAPQAPYFKQQHYKNGAYITVDKKVGQSIDFYAVQFYNQGDTGYDTYDGLFKKAGGWFSGTSVQEIVDRGVPVRKVVVGKPATTADVMNSGYVNGQSLGQFFKQWKQQTGHDPQLMFWQYLNDRDGAICRTALEIAGVDWKNYRFVDPASMMTGSDEVSKKDQNKTQPRQTSYQVPYPIYFAYSNGLASWWGDGMLAGLGVPGYTPELPYNYMALSFWLTSGTADLAYIWENAATAMSFVGGDTQSIQKKIKGLYNSKGIKLLVSAFGATQFPTSAGKDPIATANSLASFVLNNNLDGVDIDWQDNAAMQAGTGQQWLISFQTQLRNLLPNHIITHAPQAPYFKQEYYRNGGYKTIHDRVGNTIDFYTIQFYNQGNTRYDSYEELFIKATGVFSGTSVKEIMDRGVQAKKIVVGKPATMADVMNTGYVRPTDLGNWLGQFKREYNWRPSVMFWQFKNDPKGDIMKQVLSAAGVDYKDQGFMDDTTPSPTPQPQPQPQPQPTPEPTPQPTPTPTPTPGPSPQPTPSDNTVNPAPGASHVLSMFYCGFSGNFCGQSTTDDVNPKSAIVILAFANTNTDGTITVDSPNYPTSIVDQWKASGKKVILSVGGQNGHWDVVFRSDASIDNFINSIDGYLNQYSLDGIDLDIEDYKTTPRIVADTIIRLKKKIGSKLLIVSPENVAVYQATSVPSADVGGQPFNYFVPIINLADDYIDLYQPQVYNNWFGGLPGGSLAYMQETYLHWRNLQGTMAWSGPIADFKGVSGDKLVMGVLASTSAGGSQYYAPPNVIREFKSWIKQNNYPLKGFMMWDSNWDILNGMAISNAATDMNF